MDPHEITKAAVNGSAKAVALKLGKNQSWVYRLGDGPEHDMYSRFLKLFMAVDPQGRDLFFQDFQARYEASKLDVDLKPKPWNAAVAEAVKEVSEGLSAAVTNEDPLAIEREVTEGIRSLQNLLTLVHSNNEPVSVARTDS